MAQAQNHPVVLKLLAQIVAVADMTGCIIRNVLEKGELNVVEKGVNDPQTEADRSSQMCITGSLMKTFPNLKVIGEEGELESNIPEEWLVTTYSEEVLSKGCNPQFCSIKVEDMVVWVDPLDGTLEFTAGNVERVTVLIGIVVNSEPIGGAIHQPFFEKNKGRTIWGLRGIGIYGIELKQLPENRLVVTTTKSHADANVIGAVDAMKADEVLRVGGAGYKVIQLLDGTANAVVFASAGCKKWDTCAPEAILEIAGGTLTDVFGKHYNYDQNVEHPNKLGVVATAPGMNHCSLIRKIPGEIKTNLMK